MKRSKHSLSHYKLLTCDMGDLVPVCCYEVLPGDTVQQASSVLLRASPLLTPVMHPVQVRMHHWYVPNRLLWAGWEEFITGGEDGQGGSSGALPVASFTPTEGDMTDHLGYPIAALTDVSMLPVFAVNMIFNENYRDQDLVTVRAQDDRTLPKIAWEKDRFTSARPWPQKGPEVTLPLGTSAPVVSTGLDVEWSGGTLLDANMRVNLTTPEVSMSAQSGSDDNLFFGAETGLEADLSAATAVDVNTVRLAFALQRYQEARAQYGSRYTEYLRFLGVRSSDARLQRPEYLGGGKQTISFSEVLQTGTNFDANTGVATLRGHGIAAMRSRRYRRFFEEHGWVISLMSVRPKTMYASGIAKQFLRTTKEEFWQRELEQIGQDEVLNKEIYAGDSAPNDVFGYTDRYSEYRHIQSGVSGEMRSSLNMWHLARIFGGDVTLNSSFVTADPSKRIFVSQATDTLWCMVNNNIQARRMVRKGTGIGRIV